MQKIKIYVSMCKNFILTLMVSDILRKHKMKNIKNKFGFTLTELVIVVSIL